jgi:hypothetical protein
MALTPPEVAKLAKGLDVKGTTFEGPTKGPGGLAGVGLGQGDEARPEVSLSLFLAAGSPAGEPVPSQMPGKVP